MKFMNKIILNVKLKRNYSNENDIHMDDTDLILTQKVQEGIIEEKKLITVTEEKVSLTPAEKKEKKYLNSLITTQTMYAKDANNYWKRSVNKAMQIVATDKANSKYYYENLFKSLREPRTNIVKDIQITVDRQVFSLNASLNEFQKIIHNMYLINQADINRINKAYKEKTESHFSAMKIGDKSTRQYVIQLNKFNIVQGKGIFQKTAAAYNVLINALSALEAEFSEISESINETDIKAKFKEIMDAFLASIKNVLIEINEIEVPLIIAQKISKHKNELVKILLKAMKIVPLFQVHYSKNKTVYISPLELPEPPSALEHTAQEKKVRKKGKK